MRWEKLMGIGAVAAALAVAGCGSGGTRTGGTAGSDLAATVSAREVPGVGTALVNSTGNTLYFADQETNASIHCLDACLRFWLPLTVPTGATPTAGTGVTGTLATANRPDGAVQVTYDGKPLYTFAQDGGAGKAAGNGFKDSFDGTDFLWHAVAVSGTAPAPTTTGNNGYGY